MYFDDKEVQKMYFDDKEVQKSIDFLHPGNELFEVRIIKKGAKSTIYSGFFENAGNCIKALKRLEKKDASVFERANIYITLNILHSGLKARYQFNRFMQGEITTGDKDVIKRKWLLIDLDPTRPSDVSSDTAELEKAKERAEEIRKDLKQKGFTSPLVAMSGNGYHLLYCVDLEPYIGLDNDISKLYQMLDKLYSTEAVKIDVSVKNAARITKLYGTLSQKGRNIDERPHRMAKIVSVPEEVKPIPPEVLDEFIKPLTEGERANNKRQQARGAKYTIDEVLSYTKGYGIEVKDGIKYNDGIKYELSECPFDDTHKKSSCLLHWNNNGGDRFVFKCLHDSCRKYNFSDFIERVVF